MTNDSRIPSDPTKFKQWADAACVSWPGDLQVLAYRAWQWLEGMSFRSVADHEAFLASYKKFTGAV